MSDILLIDGHPNPQSLCAGLAEAYAKGVRVQGLAVRTLSLRELSFDPVLRVGYHEQQKLEPDLLDAQAAINGAQHVVLVTPLWWGSVPALLKGFIDRTLERGWAYRYKDNGMPEGLLAGRSARVIMTTDSPGWYLRLLQGSPTERQLVRSTLKFCGFKPVAFTRIGPVHSSDEMKRQKWLTQVQDLGQKDARLVASYGSRDLVY